MTTERTSQGRDVAGSGESSSPALTAFEAWRNALGITLVGCILFGLGDFIFLAGYLYRVFDLYTAAILLECGFAVSGALVFGLIVLWQRAHCSSLAALGWGRPTTLPAIICGLILAAAWIWLSYEAARRLMPQVNVTELTWTRVALAPLSLFLAIAEETMMRGFFMTQLDRARVPAWVQVVASGACSGLYHGLKNFTLIGLLPSMVIFTALAGIYVLGKRSLTPSTIAHGLVNVVGEPYLLMLYLAATNR